MTQPIKRGFLGSSPGVSVIILTRDRLPKLRACLQKLLPQLLAPDEVILIDTGSKDGTVHEFERSPPEKLRFLRFEGQGSWAEARNFGALQARNPLIAFLDDDCYAAPDWMELGRNAMRDSDAVGGLVLPYQIEQWPDWWEPEMGWLVGISVPGHLASEAGSWFYPYTSNLWTRIELLRADRFQELGGAFGANESERYHLGREDAEWWKRIRVKGCRTRFDPALRVEHHIEPERINPDYLLQRARRDGEAWARREGKQEDLDPIAYQCWARSHPASLRPTRKTAPRPTMDSLMAERHRTALAALSRKLAEAEPHGHTATRIRIRALLTAGLRFARDRAKDSARRVVLAYSPPKPWNPPIKPPKRIAVAALGFLGDMVILQSSIRGLLARHPEIRIELLAPPAAAEIFRDMPEVSPRLLPAAFPTSEEADALLDDWLNKTQARWVVAPYLHGAWGTALVRRAHRRRGRSAVSIVAFDRDEGLARQLDRDRISLRIEKKLDEHESRNAGRLFAALGLDFEALPARIEPRPEAVERARKLFGQAGQVFGTGVGSGEPTYNKRASENTSGSGQPPSSVSWLMLNPDAGTPFKFWTDGAWAELIASLLKEFAVGLIVNLSEPHPELEEAVQGADASRVLWLRRAPLEDLIAVMSLCAGLVTVDAGPQHLAHALNVPSLTLYGPMDERRWSDAWKRPIHRTIRGGNFDLTAEELRGLPENHLMRLIQPEDVLAAIRDWL